MTNKKFMSIGQIAKRTGIRVSAVRFYADEHLIPFVRTSSGHRSFDRSVIRRVSFILIAQNLGYSLKAIAKALESLPNNRTPNKSDWTRLSQRFSQDIDSRVAQLQQLRKSLDGCIACGCLSLETCTLYNPQDSAHRLGSGPRYLLGDKFSDL